MSSCINYEHLLSFKDFPKHCLLPVTKLSQLGFVYDSKDSAIRCSECDFHHYNAKTSLVTRLVYFHYQYNDNCPNIETQKEIIENALKREWMKISLPDDGLHRLDTIVQELNEKRFPNVESENKLFVRKTVDQSESKSLLGGKFSLNDGHKESFMVKVNDTNTLCESNCVNTSTSKISAEETIQQVSNISHDVSYAIRKIDESNSESSKDRVKLLLISDEDRGSKIFESKKEKVKCFKNEQQCVVCWDRDRNTMLLPCAHLVTCAECSTKLKNCPTCEWVIMNYVLEDT